MKILIIEDEIALSDAIFQYLTDEGYVCETAYDYNTAAEHIEIHFYDCILVDINLPGGSGLDLIRQVKKDNKKMGIIIISARDSVENRIEGLEIGADNYLTKPFHLAELNAHLKSINRRINFDGDNHILVNEIKILPDSHQVFVNDNELQLTKKEYELLQFFVANKNKVITKTGLAQHLWGDYMDIADSYDFIYGHIKNLRKKLIKKGCADYIKTIYGVGYKFDLTQE
ncbi:response regulator transcription factor [Draconibacterium sediminis]|uniref:Transcriptional regulator n=1 Tax=Draconibacterium sediminis TaxID=1544798 RepID=A0A0D8JA01_9BACT|nr:response regulator transcription factor [Draconibacterium sediminis]KJF42628.1 transcriptional regulator [Draconibacterium sediminis]